MNNMNMGGINAMGGPVGGGMPMMNSGAPGGILRPPMPPNDNQRQQLNTYIYEYFIRNGMFDCARSLLNSEQPLKIIKESPGRRQDNGMGNGADDGGDGDSKVDLDPKRPDDLPAPDVPRECPESCFLYEWWCLFWDMFNAQRGKGEGRNVLQYVNHTQQQSRFRQEQQNQLMRQMMPAQYQQQMMRMQQQQNGMNMGQPADLRQKAIHNTTRNQPPQPMQLLPQKNAMQRDPSSGDQQRPVSPGSAENAPSPSKRPRLDGGGNGFNPQQMPNGRGQPMPQQFQNVPGGTNPQQVRTLTQYQTGLAQQQANQMPSKGMPAAGGPANQGSPMMTPGQDTGAIAGYYNAGEMANGLRPGQQQGAQQPVGNHALQDYQTQLMLLEQQNKKRLMMARQEQVTMPGGQDVAAPGAIGPNGQPFQQGTSPQGARSVNSPNPADQMKRGTPHMNPAGMPSSPLPEGQGQSRGSPSGMNFNMQGAQMDPNMAAPYFKMNGMDPNMVGGMQNNMRPPSSHPGSHPGFANQLTPQQLAMARQENANANWQGGQNGQMMPRANPGVPPQSMAGPGTPQQRQMPPPAAPPAPATTTNGRTPGSPQQGAAPPTPQQSHKPNPKKKNDTKDNKPKRATKKGSTANINAGATPSADSTQEPATPTPATPITPIHPSSFKNGQNGAIQPIANGQPPTQPLSSGINAPLQPDPVQAGFAMDNTTGFDLQSFDFANPVNGNTDVLQDFDFDSFLHQDGEADNFNFDATGYLEGEIGAE